MPSWTNFEKKCKSTYVVQSNNWLRVELQFPLYVVLCKFGESDLDLETLLKVTAYTLLLDWVKWGENIPPWSPG